MWRRLKRRKVISYLKKHRRSNQNMRYTSTLLLCSTMCMRKTAYDMYTGKLLTKKVISVEHIIPRRYLLSREEIQDPLNLGYCHRSINSIRSDYKYGQWETIQGNLSRYKVVRAPSSSIIAGWIDPSQRIFYPYIFCNRTVIAVACFNMIQKYPSLRQIVHAHVCDVEVMKKWLLYQHHTDT